MALLYKNAYVYFLIYYLINKVKSQKHHVQKEDR